MLSCAPSFKFRVLRRKSSCLLLVLCVSCSASSRAALACSRPAALCQSRPANQFRPSTPSPARALHRSPVLDNPEERRLSITVNTLVDEADGSVTDGDVSLRDAVASVRSGETINFSVSGHINLGLGQIQIDKNLNIDGPGADRLTIDAQSKSRIFSVAGRTTASINRLTLTGGYVSESRFGGAIHSKGNLSLHSVVLRKNHAEGKGGGIYSSTGQLRLSDSTIVQNTAAYGGAVCTDSIITNGLVIERSAFFHNRADAGGALFVGGRDHAVGTATVVNSTFSVNYARNGDGGAIGTGSGAPRLTIINSTITGNQAQSAGGGLARHRASDVTLHNSIVADNVSGSYSAHNIHRSMDSASSYNLIGFGGTGGMSHGDANHNIILENGETTGLAPLGDHGGPTRTHALLPDSPAIDRGSNAKALDASGNALTVDQRGFARPFDTAPVGPTAQTVDIGAYEYEFSGLIAPREVHAKAIGGNSIQVTWQASAYATCYAVQRRQPDTESKYTTIASNVTATSYIAAC